MKFIGYFVVGFLTIAGLVICSAASSKLGSSEAKADETWRVYTPPDKSFSVEVPCDIEQRNVSAAETPTYEYSCVTLDDSALTGFTVDVVNMSEKTKPRDGAALEKNIRDEFLPNKRLTKMESIQISNGIGREFVVENAKDPESQTRARVIVVGKRRYDVAFISTDPNALKSPRAERFFSSFKPLQ